MPKLVRQGRFPLRTGMEGWMEGYFQQQRLLGGGTPEGSCESDLGGW